MKNYYEILNISESAQKEEIEDAYRREFGVWKNRVNSPDLRERQKAILKVQDLEEAKNTLSNTTKRAEYDKRFRSEELLLVVDELPSVAKELSLADDDFSLATEELPSEYSKSYTKKEKKQNFIQRLPDGIELEMIAIPAGSFMMGSQNKGKSSSDERPAHKVDIEAFHIGKYPITQEQYKAVMGENPSYFDRGGKYPVEGVNWDNAITFCRRLSKLTGRTYKIPTEAQWEYACRAGTQTSYYFGDDEKKLGQYAWYFSDTCILVSNTITEKIIGNFLLLLRQATLANSIVDFIGNILYCGISIVFNLSTHPVGKKKPNKWGLYDMLGNVLEWCEDDWHSNYQDAPTDGRAWVDNEGLSNSDYRTMRGGSWHHNAENCRCTARHCVNPIDKMNFGLRVVC